MRIGLVLAAMIGVSGTAHATLIDRGAGLIYDDILNLTWLQDTNLARTSGFDSDGRMNYATAKAWVDGLVYYDPIRSTTWSDWRLPTVAPIDGIALKRDWAADGTSEVGLNIRDQGSQLPHLFYVSLGNPYGVPPSSGPFLNIAKTPVWGEWYWTETTYPYSTDQTKYYFDYYYGAQNVSDVRNEHFAWAVRDGDVAVVPEPASGALLLAGLALVTALVRGREEGTR